MRKPSNLPLQIWLPTLVLAIFIVLLGVVSWADTIEREREHRDKSIEFLTHDMNLLCKELEANFRHMEFGKAESALTSRGVNLHYQSLLVVDDQQSVLLATRLKWKGENVNDILDGFNSTTFHTVASSNRPSVEVNQEQRTVYAYFPLELARQQSELRPTRMGALILRYDLGPKPSLISSFPANYEVLLAIFVAMAFLIWALHRSVNRPIRHLIAATESFSTESASSKDGKSGKPPGRVFDEITQLGTSLATLATRVEQRVKELETLYALSDTIRNAQSLRSLLTQAVQLIPGGCRRAHLVRARIRLDRYTYKSEGFQASAWRLRAPIEVLHQNRGVIEIYYLQNSPNALEEPFSKEEKDLLNGIANALAEAIERFEVEASKASAEGQLRQAQKMEAIGQLTGEIAHDFNNLLGIVLGNIELLEFESDLSGQAKTRLEAIQKSTERAADLTQKLLNFSRRGAGEQLPLNANQLINDLSSLFRRTLTPAISIELELADDLWTTMLDPGELEDTLLNLAVNARDAMQQGGTIVIKAQNISVKTREFHQGNLAPGEYVCISVIDNGSGIPESLIDRVMEPFFTTKPAGKGTGLGLAMVYGFVQRSHGQIVIDSMPGEGTTVNLFFPRCIEGPDGEIVETKKEISTPHGNETILCIDDEKQLLAVETGILEALGYEVLTTTSAKEALRMLAQNPDIDLLLSDVVMPGGISGFDLAEQARINHPQLRILLVSGFADQAKQHRRSAIIQLPTLAKPFTSKQLGEAVRKVLDQAMGRSGPHLAGAVNLEYPYDVPLEWDDLNSVGVDQLDFDHKKLLEFVIESRKIVEEDPAKALEIVTSIQKSCAAHFAMEERLMKDCDYPGLEHHQMLHAELHDLINHAKAKAESGDLPLNEVRSLLSSWWHDHVRIADAAYAPFLKQNQSE